MTDQRGIDGHVLLHDSCHIRHAAPPLMARATSRHNILGREPRQLMRRLIVIALFIAGIAAVIHFADFGTATAAMADMPRRYLVLIVALLTISALVRAWRWSYYLRAAGLDIAWHDGVTSYLASMSASALPASSLLSARLAQEHGHVRMREATPALFVSYVADALALSALALGFSVITHQPPGRYAIPVAGLALSGVLIAMGRSARVWKWVDRLLGRFRLTRRWQSKEADVHERVAALMRPSVVARGAIISLLTTLLSILLLMMYVNALTVRGVTLLEASTVHTTAETVGVVVPVAAIFSVSDSSLAGMLNALGIGWVRVVFILLTMRSFSLIFRTLFGTTVLVTSYRPLLLSALNVRGRAGTARRHCGRVWRFSCKSSVILERLGLRARRSASNPLASPVVGPPLPKPQQPKHFSARPGGK
jgi:uncharacterized membrane protein YbhN (UPF0104 family)